MSQFGEVATVFGKVGRADTGTDPAPYSMAETVIRLRPRAEWPRLPRRALVLALGAGPASQACCGWSGPTRRPRTTAELVAALDDAVRLPGWTGAWTAPARARMDMMATGVRTPVGIRIVSPDPARLDALGTAVRARVAALAGHAQRGVRVAGRRDLARLRGRPRGAGAHGRRPGAGRVDGRSAHDRRPARRDRGRTGAACACASRPSRPTCGRAGPADQLREVTIRAPAPVGDGGQPVPLALLGRPDLRASPAVLRTEHGELCAYVYVDLPPGADLQGYVERARRDVAAAIARRRRFALAPGERIEWTGQYQLLAAGQQPAALDRAAGRRCRCWGCCSCSSAA